MAKSSRKSIFLSKLSDNLNDKYFYYQTIKFYNQISQDYDLVYGDHIRGSEKLVKIIYNILKKEKIKPKFILDVGCGIGQDLINLKKMLPNCKLFGLDISPKMVHNAKLNLRKNSVNATLWKGNILEPNFGFSKKLENMDLILFRGNPLSNLDYDDYKKAFNNVYSALNAKGIFLFDFRDGKELFKYKLPIEIRDYGFKKNSGKFYLSAYFQEHPLELEKPYHLTTVLLTLKTGQKVPKLKYLSIYSHYVIFERVEQALKNCGFNYWKDITKSVGESLPFLKTYIAIKK